MIMQPSQPKAQQGNVLILTISILFLVATQILTMGLLSGPTTAMEASASSANQEAKEEAAAAVMDARISLIRWINARANYGNPLNWTNLQANRTQFEFTNKKYYVLNDAFNDSVASPFSVSTSITATTGGYLITGQALGKGVRYSSRSKVTLADVIPTTGFAQTSYLRDALGLLETLLVRGYAFSSTGDKFNAAITEGSLSSSTSSNNQNQGIRCATIVGGSCAPFWGSESEFGFNLGGIKNVSAAGILNAAGGGEWADPADGGAIILPATALPAANISILIAPGGRLLSTHNLTGYTGNSKYVDNTAGIETNDTYFRFAPWGATYYSLFDAALAPIGIQ